jgi:hypothetical protein
VPFTGMKELCTVFVSKYSNVTFKYLRDERFIILNEVLVLLKTPEEKMSQPSLLNSWMLCVFIMYFDIYYTPTSLINTP